MRRVVVTGMGIVCPLGLGLEHVWQRLLQGCSGLSSLRGFDSSSIASKVAGHVPEGDATDGAFDLDAWVTPKDRRKMDRFIIYALVAARMAVKHAALVISDEAMAKRSGVMIGSGIGGLDRIEKTVLEIAEKGVRRLNPFFIPSCLVNLASGYVSIEHNLKGPNHAVATACAAGTHAIGDAAKLIATGKADVMIAGGAEAAVCHLGMASFAAMRALSTKFNDQPMRASRPWDLARDGFVMGEGAGILVLEALDHATARGAELHGEVLGYGLSGDASHITAPAEDGDGGFRAMEAALCDGAITADQIGYVNAHGTSTPLGDLIELAAIKKLMGDHARHIPISSTKSSIGHLLGAAGAVEAIFILQALKTGAVPPTLNLDDPAPESAGFNLVPHEAQQHRFDIAMSNSFGFGGTNASIVLGRT
ncbi:MAG: beta-ketoacyl-ACP synthase II [Pseudomonadota bacterium]